MKLIQMPCVIRSDKWVELENAKQMRKTELKNKREENRLKRLNRLKSVKRKLSSNPNERKKPTNQSQEESKNSDIDGDVMQLPEMNFSTGSRVLVDYDGVH